MAAIDCEHRSPSNSIVVILITLIFVVFLVELKLPTITIVPVELASGARWSASRRGTVGPSSCAS